MGRKPLPLNRLKQCDTKDKYYAVNKGAEKVSNRLCGVCNEYVPVFEEQIGKFEKNGDITPYHMHCEYEARKIVTCEDCGLHRKFCNECKE